MATPHRVTRIAFYGTVSKVTNNPVARHRPVLPLALLHWAHRAPVINREALPLALLAGIAAIAGIRIMAMRAPQTAPAAQSFINTIYLWMGWGDRVVPLYDNFPRLNYPEGA